ncbi:MAG TPA: LysR family transcriptional regulator [Mycobacterium sp.]
MELRQLQYFVAVAEELHFTRAAARVHVVQSTLSASISSLEQELGTALLVRNSRRVDLTAAGHALLPDAHRALAAADSARAAVDAVLGVLRGHLAIGMVPGLGIVDVPGLLARYNQRYPRIDVALRRDAVGNLIQATVDGDLDLAFVYRPFDGRQVEELPLGTDSLVLAVPRDDPLAEKGAVALADLSDREFIDRPAGFSTRLHVDAVFAELGFQRTICAESNTANDLVHLVEAGLGVAFLSPALLKGSDRVVGIPTEPAISRELAIVTPLERPLSPAAAAFLADEVPTIIGRSECGADLNRGQGKTGGLSKNPPEVSQVLVQQHDQTAEAPAGGR